MQRSLEQYRLLVEKTPALMRSLRGDGTCDYVNEAWLGLTGSDPETAPHEVWSTSVHPEDVQRCTDAIRAHGEAQHPLELTYRVRRHDGEYRWVLERLSPLAEAPSAPRGLAGAALDVHDLRSEREAKTRALSKAAHDLRTPLQSLVLFAGEAKSVVESGGPLRPKFAEGLERLSNRLKELADRLTAEAGRR